ncbi:MAG: hypothetical protein KME30_30485 [Iphinoe sp. HA4291-MV1]|jgi:hypothetical protein|nr:hypothetical protein [Iphinoe sp. HA4291-MV1]
MKQEISSKQFGEAPTVFGTPNQWWENVTSIWILIEFYWCSRSQADKKL